EAVSVTGPVGLTATNCSFGPHAALFHVHRGSGLNNSSITLAQCSAYLVNGPAFRLDDGAAAKLEVRHSLFARRDDGKGSPVALIWQTGTARDQYTGRDNYFAQIEKFWMRAADREDPLVSFVSFPEAARGDRPDAKESQSLVGNTLPWQREWTTEELE